MVRPEDHPLYWTSYLSVMLTTAAPHIKDKHKRQDVEQAVKDFERSTVASDHIREQLQKARGL